MAQINKPTDYFNTLTWTGDGNATRSYTGVGFQPDLIWSKNRSATDNHGWTDAIRGVNKRLQSSTNGAEITDPSSGYLSSFDSDGFSVQAGSSSTANFNTNTENYVAWNWLGANGTASNTDGSITSNVSANTTSGFSIVSWTGTGANATIGHGIDTPKMIIVKQRTDATTWYVGHDSLGWDKYINLDSTSASTTNTTLWQNTAPTSSVFSVGSSNSINGSGDSMIAYCFAEKKGFSKFGSYTGNGNSDGTFVYTGFKPAMVIIKNTTTAGTNWNIHDSARDTDNPVEKYLHPNTSDAEPTTIRDIDFLSNGFKPRTGNSTWNGSGSSYIYMAFAESPLVGTNNTPAVAR